MESEILFCVTSIRKIGAEVGQLQGAAAALRAAVDDAAEGSEQDRLDDFE